MDDSIFALEQLFLALADKTRLRLLSLMAGGEVSVGYLAENLGESQPKVSRHLAYLRSAGLVTTRRDGKWIFYRVSWPAEPAAARVMSCLLDNLGTAKPVWTTASASYSRADGMFGEMHDETQPEAATEERDWQVEREEMDVFLL